MMLPDQFNYRELVVSRFTAEGLLKSQWRILQVRTLPNLSLCQKFEFGTARAVGLFIYLFIYLFNYGLYNDLLVIQFIYFFYL